MLKKLTSSLASFLFSFFLVSQLHAQSCCYDSCDDCGCFWIGAEYLYWKIEDSPAPVPLVTQGTLIAPAIGSPGTSIILGKKHIDTNWRSGGRFSIGYWFGSACCYGLEASYFFLPNDSKSKSVSATGLPGSLNLGVPFFNVLTSSKDAYELSTVGQYTGFGSFKVKNRMQGAELNGLMAFCSQYCYNFDLLLGFRYWNFQERATFFASSPIVNLPNDIYNSTDKFKAKNNFYGGQVGFVLTYSYNCFFINVKGKVALGADCGEVDINGVFKTNEFSGVFGEGPAETFKGGIFALPSNIGHHKKTFFCVIPEANVNLGYQVLEWLNLQVGYTFIYVSKAFWGTNQIDRKINPTQSPPISDSPNPVLIGEASPKFLHKTHSLWVQGLSAGIEFSF